MVGHPWAPLVRRVRGAKWRLRGLAKILHRDPPAGEGRTTRRPSRRPSQGELARVAPRRSTSRTRSILHPRSDPLVGRRQLRDVDRAVVAVDELARTGNLLDDACGIAVGRVGPVHAPVVGGDVAGVVDHDRAGSDRGAELGEQQRPILGDRLGEALDVADRERARSESVGRLASRRSRCTAAIAQVNPPITAITTSPPSTGMTARANGERNCGSRTDTVCRRSTAARSGRSMRVGRRSRRSE